MPWIKGGLQDAYITNYILTGLGKLNKAGILSPEIKAKLNDFIIKGLGHLTLVTSLFNSTP